MDICFLITYSSSTEMRFSQCVIYCWANISSVYKSVKQKEGGSLSNLITLDYIVGNDETYITDSES